MHWAEHFPEHCPPETSEYTHGIVYRFIEIEHENPLPNDFLSWKELHNSCPDNVSECQCCGVSVYKSPEEIHRMSKKVPKLRKMKVARGNLNEDMGRIKNTPSRNSNLHYTWWIPTNIEPWKMFYKVERSSLI
jgi:hypothetical protein